MTVSARILVVENDYCIARDLTHSLERMGYEILGPVPSVAEAIVLIGKEHLGGAVLDVELNDERSFPVADLLAAQGIPFLYFTSMDRSGLPTQFSNRPLIDKLASFSALEQALHSLIAPPAAP